MGNVVGIGGHLPAGDTEGSSVQSTLAYVGSQADKLRHLLVLGVTREGRLAIIADRELDLTQGLNLTVIAQRILTDQMIGAIDMGDDE